MKALVISGGGSKGAFGGGVAEYLMKEQKRKYDLYVGSSTGSLLLPLLSIGEIDRIKKVYCSVTQKDIFNINPFKIRKEGNRFRFAINHRGILWNMLRGGKTFGRSDNLRQLIARTVTEDDFKRLQDSPADVVVTVSNLSTNETEYKSVHDYEYEEWLDWLWISANAVPFMSLVTKGRHDYADGGTGNLVPALEAINRGATEVDVVVLMTEKPQPKMIRSRNAFGLILRLAEFMIVRGTSDDITIATLTALQNNVRMRFFFTPRNLTDNVLIFDSEQMTGWWQEGLEYAKERWAELETQISQGPKKLEISKHVESLQVRGKAS